MIRLWTLVGFFGLLSIWNCASRIEAPAATPEPIAAKPVVVETTDAGVGLEQFGSHSEKLIQLVMDARVNK